MQAINNILISYLQPHVFLELSIVMKYDKKYHATKWYNTFYPSVTLQ